MTKAIESLSGPDQAAVRTGIGLGSAATQASTAFATAAQGAKADTALQPGALPVGTTLPAAQISDSTSAGRALLTGANASAQRTSLGLGTAATQASTTFINILSSGIPFILAGNATMGANGAISGLPNVPYAYKRAYIYLPAGAAFSGSVDGWYYAEFPTSATSGTVYNNRYTSGIPTAPDTKTPIVASAPGAYTQITSWLIPSVVVVVPGGALGNGGILKCDMLFTASSDEANKVRDISLGGQTFGGYTSQGSTLLRNTPEMRCLGTETQIGTYYSASGASSDPIIRMALNTALDQVLVIAMRIPGSTSCLVLESAVAEIVNGV